MKTDTDWTISIEELMREPAKVMVFHDEAAIRADESEKIAQRLREDGAGPAWIERMTGAKPKMDLAAWCERVISAHRAGDASGARHALRQAQSCADSPNPKTREQVLEEALREIEPLTTNETWQQEAIRKSNIARRALEWKP